MHKHAKHKHPSGIEELFEFRHIPLKKLWIALAITLAGMILEIGGGIVSGSLALLSDAGHMFTHLFALSISAIALRLTREAPCHHRTFGWLRAEVLAAYTNALFLFGVTVAIGYESIMRLVNAEPILFREMFAVAIIGLVVNIISIALLHGHNDNISIRSTVAHMIADTLSSVTIVVGAIVMHFTGWWWIDAVLSFGIAAVILVWAWRLFIESSHILMEIAPAHINTDDVTTFILTEFPDIIDVKRVRIWSITEGITSLTAELRLKGTLTGNETEVIRASLSHELKQRFAFTETTLELGHEI